MSAKKVTIRPEQWFGWGSILFSIAILAAVSWYVIQDLQPLRSGAVAVAATPTPTPALPSLMLNTVHQRQGVPIVPSQTSTSRTNPFIP